MATIRSTFRTNLSRRAQDTAGDIADGEKNACIQSAIDEINRKCPFLPETGYICPDGSAYEFDLSDSGIFIPSTSGHLFLKLSDVSIEGYGFLTSHPDGMSYIRKLRAKSTTMLSNAEHAIMKGKVLVVDSVMSDRELITDTDSQDFTDDTGHWADIGAASFVASGGVGIVTSPATTTILALTSSFIDALVVGERYRLSLDLAYATAWTGGLVTVSCGGSSGTITLTTTMTTLILDFVATTTSSTISISSASIPASGNQLKIDNVHLRSPYVILDYFRKHMVFTADSDTPEGILADGWDRMILALAQIHLGESMADTRGSQMIKEGKVIFDEQFKDFESAVAQNNELYRESQGQGYQDFRNLGGGFVGAEQPYNGNTGYES